MTVTAKDLRFNISMLFDLLSKGEDILITYRGKAKAKLISYNDEPKKEKTDLIFGMWKDRDSEKTVEQYVQDMRKGRDFDI